jgi:hypothetical protein
MNNEQTPAIEFRNVSISFDDVHLNSGEMIVEDFARHVEELKDGPVGYRIVDVRPFFARDDDVLVAQNRELLRGVRRLDGEFLTDLIDRQFPFPQGVEDRNPQRVRQRLEEFRFEVAQLLPHRTLRCPDDRSQIAAGFSICASLQVLALTPTRVKPALRSDCIGSQIIPPPTPRPPYSRASRPCTASEGMSSRRVARRLKSCLRPSARWSR